MRKDIVSLIFIATNLCTSAVIASESPEQTIIVPIAEGLDSDSEMSPFSITHSRASSFTLTCDEEVKEITEGCEGSKDSNILTPISSATCSSVSKFTVGGDQEGSGEQIVRDDDSNIFYPLFPITYNSSDSNSSGSFTFSHSGQLEAEARNISTTYNDQPNDHTSPSTISNVQLLSFSISSGEATPPCHKRFVSSMKSGDLPLNF